MREMQFHVEADASGVIHLDIPVGSGGNYDVQVTVTPEAIRKATPEELGWPPGYFENAFDTITDPAFERGDQGVPEEREPFE
jgi:hypothetical protein